MSGDARRTISVTCEVHGEPRELVASDDGDRVVLDLHADSCCSIGFDEPAVCQLIEFLGDWLE